MIFLYFICLILSWTPFLWIMKKIPSDSKLKWREMLLVMVWFTIMISANVVFVNELLEVIGLKSLIKTQ